MRSTRAERRGFGWCAFSLVVLWGCDPMPVAVDAPGADAGTDAAPSTELLPAAAAIAPDFACLPGYQAVDSLVREGVAIGCDPWGSEGPTLCASGSMRLPGTRGCVVVGSACPVSGYPPAPGGTAVRYVNDAGGPGDGTLTLPHGSLDAALQAAVSGEVLLLAPGRYAASRSVPAGVSFLGACAASTTIRIEGTWTVGAGVSLSDVSITGSGSPLLSVPATASLTLTDAAIEGPGQVLRVDGSAALTRVSAHSLGGVEQAGIGVRDGGSLELSHSELRGFAIGITALGSTASVVLTNVVVGRIGDAPSIGYGGGLFVSDGAQLTAHGLVLDRLFTFGLHVSAAGSVDVEDAWIEGVSLVADSSYAVHAGGARVSLTRTTIVDASGNGVVVLGGGEFHWTDGALEEVVSAGLGGGHGLDFAEASSGSLERVLVFSTTSAGIVVTEASRLSLADIEVASVFPEVADGFGLGITVQRGSHLTGSRLSVRDTVLAGLAFLDSAGELADVSVQNVAPSTTGTAVGYGLAVFDDSEVTVDRVHFLRCAGQSVQVFSTPAHLVLRDALLESTLSGACLDEACTIRSGGTGAGAYAGGLLEFDRFVIVGSALAGIQLAHGATDDGAVFEAAGRLSAREGWVHGNPIGINLQSTDTVVLDGIRFSDNDEDVVYRELPVPRPPEGL